MSTDDAVALRTRVGAGVRQPANWLELVRFGAVGGSGYVVNLLVFTAVVELTHADHKVAALAAFLVAVANNFLWNRRWTFRAHDGHAGFQAARFLAVSVGAFLFSFALLELLVVSVGVAEIPAQAISIVCATPLSFLGNKLWTFDR